MENHLNPSDPKSYALRGLVPRVLEYLYASIASHIDSGKGRVSSSWRRDLPYSRACGAPFGCVDSCELDAIRVASRGVCVPQPPTVRGREIATERCCTNEAFQPIFLAKYYR